MRSAIGIVIPIVNAPQALSARALTTTKPSPASAATTMKRIAAAVAKPDAGPSSSRAISARDFHPERTEAAKITKSWTAPPKTAPGTSHKSPGSHPYWAASTGPIKGPAPAIAAK